MLTGKELKMYEAETHIVRVTCIDGDVLEGKCVEFISASANEPDEATITLRSPSKNGGKSPGELVEIAESEITEIEIIE